MNPRRDVIYARLNESRRTFDAWNGRYALQSRHARLIENSSLVQIQGWRAIINCRADDQGFFIGS